MTLPPLQLSDGYPADEALRDQRKILARIARGEEVHSVLREIALFAERRAPGGTSVNLMMYDESSDELLSTGGQPSLPDAFLAALQGLRPGPAVGSCGTAAYRREQVITEDVVGDELWIGLDQLMVDNGFRASWSTPILDAHGDLLGTFGMYFPDVRSPTSDEYELMDLFVYLGALALERARSDARLQRLSDEDWLTGLINGRAFFERIGTCLDGGSQAAVILLEIDGLSHLTGSRGHGAANEVMREIAETLTHSLPEDATLARLWGSSMAVMLPNAAIPDVMAAAVIGQLAVGVGGRVDGISAGLSACAGVAVSEPGLGAEELVARADTAQRHARGIGRGSIAVFDAQLAASDRALQQLVDDLRRAVEQGEITVAYQPIVDLATGELIAVEALARWHRESPAVFIPLAEGAGIVHEIGMTVLDAALSALAGWSDRAPDLVLHVNLSPEQLRRTDLVESVLSLLAKHGVEPSRLVLEITESSELAAESALEPLSELIAQGVSLSLDDFGTGYSSPGRLVSMPFDTLKIDRSFVSAIDDLRSGTPVARLLMAFGRELGMEVIAEGVETEAQRQRLLEMGCRVAQGFLFSKPLSESDTKDVLGAMLPL